MGDYTVLQPLGEGGMAKTLLATSPGGARVVLKVPLAHDADSAARLRDEARIGARLHHPAIVETLDLFEHQGSPVLVVAYIDGCTLQDARRAGPMHPAAVCRVGAHVAAALHAIHTATDGEQPLHMLHRDVTPGNVLLDKQGNAKLIDLGIARSVENQARRTAVGVIKGTMRYLAPDIIEGKPYSVETDLWALGVCLWEALLGRPALRGGDAIILAAIAAGRTTELKEGEQVHGEVGDVVRTLLGKPGARFSQARAVATVFTTLEARLGDGASVLRGLAESPPPRKPRRAPGGPAALPLDDDEHVYEPPSPQPAAAPADTLVAAPAAKPQSSTAPAVQPQSATAPAVQPQSSTAPTIDDRYGAPTEILPRVDGIPTPQYDLRATLALPLEATLPPPPPAPARPAATSPPQPKAPSQTLMMRAVSLKASRAAYVALGLVALVFVAIVAIITFTLWKA